MVRILTEQGEDIKRKKVHNWIPIQRWKEGCPKRMCKDDVQEVTEIGRNKQESLTSLNSLEIR
jgi:hypothetical protein